MIRVAESAQVDDLLDTLPGASLRKVPRSNAIHLLEVIGCTHRMHQVISRFDSGQRPFQRILIQNVTRDNFGLRPCQILQPLWTSAHTADRQAMIFQEWPQTPPDIAGGTGQQDLWSGVLINQGTGSLWHGVIAVFSWCNRSWIRLITEIPAHPVPNVDLAISNAFWLQRILASIRDPCRYRSPEQDDHIASHHDLPLRSQGCLDLFDR